MAYSVAWAVGVGDRGGREAGARELLGDLLSVRDDQVSRLRVGERPGMAEPVPTQDITGHCWEVGR